MFRKALITSLAISAAVAAPAAAKPADVFVVNTVSVAGTVGLEPGTSVGLEPGTSVGLEPGASVGLEPGTSVGLDPAANGVEITNSAPIPVAPVTAPSQARVVNAGILLEPGEDQGSKVLISTGAIEGRRFEANLITAITSTAADEVPSVQLVMSLAGRSALVSVPMVPTPIPSNGTVRWEAVLPAPFMTDGELSVHFSRNGPHTGQDLLNLAVFGHFVDVPAAS